MTLTDLITRQREFFATDATRSVEFRREQLTKLHAALVRNQPALLEAVYLDFKKSAFDAYTTELMLVLHDIDEAVKRLPRWTRRRRVRTNLLNLPGSSYVVAEPLGVSLIIGAWNYPYLLSLAPLVAALAAGNTVILKPSELPRATSAVLARIIGETFAPEYCAVVEGGVAETTELLRHRFDKVFFTGSTHVGKLVYQAAAAHLTPVTLELGGKSPAFVTADCDLALAARRIVWGKFLNAGQTCIAPDYVLVDAALEERFLAACRDEITKANYSIDNDNYVQIINDRHFQRLHGLIARDKVYHGGNTDAAARIIEPTLLRDVSFDDAVMQEEIFGPILPVIAYSRLDDAIARAKSMPAPLSCYVFASDERVQRQVFEHVPFGGGTINDTVLHIANPYLPFGGVGASGVGRYHGQAGFLTFSNQKGVLRKATWVDLALRYSPLTPSKLLWLKRLMRWQSWLT